MIALEPGVKTRHAFSNPQSEFRNPQSCRSCSSNGRARRFETGVPGAAAALGWSYVEAAGSSPARSSILECGGLDAALDLLFEIRLLSTHPNIQSAVEPAHSKTRK